MVQLRHEIIHGDATDLLWELDDHSVNCVVTDPPYGIDYRSNKQGKTRARQFAAERLASDGEMQAALDLFLDVMVPVVEHKLADDSDVYIFTAWNVVDQWTAAISEIPGLRYAGMLVWDKAINGLGDLKGTWGCGFELILQCKKGRRELNARVPSVLRVDRMRHKNQFHPTEKPPDIFEAILKQCTTPGELVLDPFAGSGAAIVAARNLGLSGVGFEVNEDYARRANERFNQMAFPL